MRPERSPKMWWHLRTRTALGALTLGIVLGLALLPSSALTLVDKFAEVAAGDRPLARATTDTMESEFPSGLYPAVISALRAGVDAAYQVAPAAVSQGKAPKSSNAEPGPQVLYQASNAAQGLLTAFTTAGIRVSSLGEDEGWTFGLRLVGYGYGGRDLPLPEADMAVEGPRFEYRYDGKRPESTVALTEWFVNSPLGLEQGFTVQEPLAERKAVGPLQFMLAYTGGLSPRQTPDGRSVEWTDTQGQEVLRYSGLLAYDALGRELPARMAMVRGGIVLRVEDEGAAYPVTVDPHILGVELQPAPDGNEFMANLGWSSAINGDGTTVVVGAPRDRDNGIESGTAYVFVKNGGVWSQQQELQPDPDGSTRGSDSFGWSVSISTDGDTVAVGGIFADCVDIIAGCGATYVFKRNAGAWTQAAKIVQAVGDRPGDLVTDDGSSDQFGYSVALSGDGRTLLVGARYDDDDGPNSGSAYVYVENAGAWNLEQKLLRFPDPAFPPSDDPVFWGQIANFGNSVGISNDGDTAVIGAPGIPGDCPALNLADCGSAFVFVRNAGIWSQEAELAPGAANLGFDMKFGASVAMSGDGQTLVVGAPDGNQNDPSSGQAFVFEKKGGVWSQQAALQPPVRSFSGAQCCEEFGSSVAIGDNGSTLAVGRPENDLSNALGLSGAAFVFFRRAGAWSNGHLLQQGQADIGQGDFFGYSVGVSGDGSGLVAGAPHDDDNGSDSGSAYVFDLSDLATITIVKDSVPDDATDFPMGMFGEGFPQVDFSLDDDADATLSNSRVFLVAPGEYFAFESIGGVPDWQLTDRACVDPDNGSSIVQGGLLAGIGVDIDADAGEDIICTFTNTNQALAPPVPGLSEWGLIALVVLLGAAIVWRLGPANLLRRSG